MTLHPLVRGRVAFTALSVSLCVIAADRTVTSGDPSLLLFFAPAIAVIATGHVSPREAFLRSGLSVAAIIFASILVNLAHGRSVPNFQDFSAMMTALTGVFALNLAIVVATSFAVRKLWPSSDHWTR